MAEHVDHGDYECDGEVCRPKKQADADVPMPPVAQAAPASNAAVMATLLGDQLVSKSGKVLTSTLVGKYIFVYFSAGWCGPCRAFTPMLKEFYKLKEAKGFEVVWVSSDHDEKGYAEYYAIMPWLALPFEDRARKTALSRKFKVQGVPTLVLLAPDGSLVTSEARNNVSQDPAADLFPWRPLTPLEALGSSFLSKRGAADVSSVSGKYVGVYFSASWCGPCRAFLPVLSAVYEKLRAAGKPFEIVWVSSDQDQASFDAYYAKMPWLAVPFSDRARAAALSGVWNVEGIPTLVILGPDGKTVNASGRGAIMQDPEGAEFPWAPRPVQSIAEADYLNEETIVIACCATQPADVKKAAFSAMEAAAKQLGGVEVAGCRFVVADERNGVVQQIRALTHLGDVSRPHLVIVDIPDGGAWYDCGGQITAEAVVQAVANFKAGALERKQLGRP